MTRHCALSPHQLNRLDLACIPIREAFDQAPYLVGSTMTRPERSDWRDVDVRLILSDEDFDSLFDSRRADSDGALHGDPLWTLLCSALSEWLGSIAGLPVDFQIQRRAEANTAHPTAEHPRNPLAMMRAWSGGTCAENERELLWSAGHAVEPIQDTGKALFATVERILAERVRAARAEALRDAADAALEHYGTWGGAGLADWLRDRANRIEAGDA